MTEIVPEEKNKNQTRALNAVPKHQNLLIEYITNVKNRGANMKYGGHSMQCERFSAKSFLESRIYHVNDQSNEV